MPPARTSSFTALNLFMLLFAASAVLGVLPAYVTSLSTAALTAILGSVLLYFALAFLVRSWLALRIVSAVALLIAAGFALYFISQFGYQNYPETPELIQRLGAITTLPFQMGEVTLHPNAAATFLGVAVPLGVGRAISGLSGGRRLFWWLCVLAMLYAILLTYSRGAWVALAVVMGLALAIVAVRRLPHEIAVPIVGLGLIAVLGGIKAVVVLGPARFPFLASAFARVSDRGVLFQNSLHLAGDYLFTGIGLGDTFGMVYSRYSLLIFVPFLTYAHNLPLAVWLNQGLLGLVAFVGVVVTFYVFVYRVVRSTEPRHLFYGAWLGVTATLLHGLIDAPQYADHHWVMPALFVGIGLAVASGRLALGEVQDASDIQPGVFWRWIAVSGAIAIAGAAMFVVFNRQIMTAWYTNLGAIDETRADLAPEPRATTGAQSQAMLLPGLTPEQRDAYTASARAWYEQALALDPTYPNANRRLGNLLVNLGEFDAALPYLEAAFAGEPGYPATIKGLGLAYVWVGRLQDAVDTIALHDDPDSIRDELNTWGYYRRDDLHQPLLAARAWETAQLMSPGSTNLDVWLLIADTYYTADDVEDARRWYERVLEVEPDNQPAQDALAAMEG